MCGRFVLFFRQSLIVLIATLGFTTGAFAQVCKESNANAVNGKANLGCDMRYHDAVIACDTKNSADIIGTRPSCPKKPMPMIDTPKASYIADYTPYLFSYPRDPSDPSRPYVGAYSIGTSGDATRTYQMIGNTPSGTKRLAGCTTQIRTASSPRTPLDDAKIARLQLDNCTNQYILNTSLYPFQKENTALLSMDDPANPGKLLSTATECQPIRTFTETENEYSASEYLQAAWKKTLQDPNYRKTSTIVPKYTPCILPGWACDREPHLPSGVRIDNPLRPPSPFPEVLLSTIAAVPYEEIVDPTHPFSPRWDFKLNDRDYSNISTQTPLSTAAVLVAAAVRVYMSEPKNSVFCAGVREAKQGTTGKKKDDAEVRVDVLEFRRGAFESVLQRRAVYNAICYEHIAIFTSGDDAAFYVAPLSFCWTITGFSWVYPWVYAKEQECWKCFGLSGQVDDEDKHPPCTTHYLGKDLSMDLLGGWFPGGFNAFKLKANCGGSMAGACEKLRKPYTQLNKLKMRYHNPDDEEDKDGDNIALKDGVMEGLTFSEYFGNHMPYPRLWDTGTPLLNSPATNGNAQPPLDTTGQYTAIVGVGREASAKAAAKNAPADADGIKPEDKYTDQRCKTGGWGGVMGITIPWQPVSFAGVNFILPDPITSWTELKLYQARTNRTIGMSCLGRYEKVFKPGSAENLILMAAGADWSKLIVSKCPQTGGGRTGQCTYMTLKQYSDAGKPENSETTLYIKDLKNDLWPNSWRGYMAAENVDNQFPSFGDAGALVDTGLDTVEQGDIILLPYGAGGDAASPGLAKLALVIETNTPNDSDCMAKKNCYVKVLEPDNGKWPDVCGTTDTWGEMKARYYYKSGHLPEAAATEYKRIKTIQTCKQTAISHCEQTEWDNLNTYRIRDDVRPGCTKKDKAVNCTKDE